MQSAYRLLNITMQFSVYQKLHFHFQGQIGDVEKPKRKIALKTITLERKTFVRACR